MGAVFYRVLGTTAALRPDGSAVPLGGARLRALLTVLAVRAGRSVSATVLADEVWGADPPAEPQAALQALVGRLRRALGPGAIVSEHAGYRLDVPPDAVDLHRFGRLADEGRAALDAGEPARAAGLLDEALALWAEPPLADLPEAEAEARHWTERLRTARTARWAAALDLGHAEEALPPLTALCRAHPLDEPLHLLRLRALRDTGRPAEALAAYAGLARTLADRLGTDPGPALRALHTELLGAGERSAPGRAPAPEPARPPRTGNLPARLTSFVGRGTDIETLRADLAGSRLVTLLGPGGSGKTRLSQETAETLRDRAPDGVWLAELAPVTDPESVPAAVLGAVGGRETVLRGAGAEEFRVATDRQHDDVLTRLTEYCAPRRMLLLLDNCEHVVGAAAHLAQTLLERCPRLTIIATSREPLGVPGEVLRPVEPLPEPAARRLFSERAAAVSPGFTPATEPEAVAEICRRLDGLPLAIELAAARLRLLTPRQIADRLDDRFRLLTTGSRTVLPRQQTLRAVVDWSWDLLDARERAVLARLSVFAGGCDLAAVEAVCAAPGAPAADVADVLGALVDKSLVIAAPAPDGTMRYRLLETVAEYAAARLAEEGTATATRHAHLLHYRELARTTDPLLRGPEQGAAIARLEAEYENLRLALREALERAEEQEVLCLVLSLSWYWQIRGPRGEAVHWAGAAAALGPDPFAEGAPEAPPVAESCTAAPPPWDGTVLDEARRGVHLIHLAHMDMDFDHWSDPTQRARLHRAAEVYRPGLPQTCRPPANVWFFAVLFTGNLALVRDVADSTVRTARELDLPWELALALQNRANLLANRADLDGDALSDAGEALRIFRELGDSWGAAEALAARAEVLEWHGRYTEAAADYEEATEHALTLGAHSQTGVLRARMGGLLTESDDPGESARGEKLLREIFDEEGPASTEARPVAHLFLAMRYAGTGRLAEARQVVDRLRDDFGNGSFVLFDSMIGRLEGWLDALEGRYDQSLSRLGQSVDSSFEDLALLMAPQLPAGHLQTAAYAFALRGTARRSAPDLLLAARLLAAVSAALPAPRHESRVERELHAETERLITAAAEDPAFPLAAPALRTARAEGARLGLREGLDLLREAAPPAPHDAEAPPPGRD
ncbi:Predicted ATPase [Streptomyces sp. TverLS-915]|uniref:BTAD domain-containing putative transcriptional regulator n=1 Tax=Streptomyces sp. TverLS-915 TaxID=1839763 RepID=UPI00081F1F6D|nr:BTAD domain-containing putative transcriptional regulator [Streptomyces sp. TverLS-915]SCD91763.1 Predicted ATPase [Streptomyces sp. TverLS-915]